MLHLDTTAIAYINRMRDVMKVLVPLPEKFGNGTSEGKFGLRHPIFQKER